MSKGSLFSLSDPILSNMKLFVATCGVAACAAAASTLRGVTTEEHKPFYHMEGSSRRNPICYETTYIDGNYESQGFVIGACDSKYSDDLGHETVEVCDGHSEVNIKDCTTQVIDIVVYKLGRDSDGVEDPHKPFYHLESALENVCYETTYIDAHYEENGFVIGACDESYDSVLAKDDEEVCDGHSEINEKNCPTSMIEIEVIKLGKATDDVEDPPHSPQYHLVAEMEAVCYETNYTDAHYEENGFVLGVCDESFNTIISKDTETICNGHSEENIRYCPDDTVNITIYKFGKA